jgi:hypothetical protein
MESISESQSKYFSEFQSEDKDLNLSEFLMNKN